MKPLDPVGLAQALICRPSVTPAEAGVLDLAQEVLAGLGFRCRRLRFEEVDNLYARLGEQAPNFCFAGHLDVVPAGDESAWTHPPFAAEIADGRLWGRGATDMKGGVACFLAAISRFVAGGPPHGSISVLLTCDEEGPARNGTVRVLQWLQENGEVLDACLLGEPSNPEIVGEMVKIGRRGSLNGVITTFGVQGHTAYGHLADNPIPRLMRILQEVAGGPLDDGTPHFQPSVAEITSIDVGNPVTNVIPAKARGAFNIRFNDRHTGAGLVEWIRARCESVGGAFALETTVTAESFLVEPGRFSALVVAAVERETGRTPRLDTSGGTSDARFIKDFCPVAEFGLTSATAHKADENVRLSDLESVTSVYARVLDLFFAESGRC